MGNNKSRTHACEMKCLRNRVDIITKRDKVINETILEQQPVLDRI